ncbi:hypothetical protein FCL47_15400 [Desulfopila sp. IMCC35006]|uniref:hypothetical protein n=1 Tax=Desulfopila sp. IMCC35006 TaxID=2569542 RepID=UPI0010ACA563|nr:hypothetical protein [Desulfopila sp. IMCC35006]TKB25032.1 hypothetical protein FCL47_15400 [Desulfopila sp. IMCC35006]
MEKKFTVSILSFQKIGQIEGAWSADDYKALLTLMEFEDELESMSESDLREMCLMSLNDFEASEAARFVLTHITEGELPDGKIDQISHDMIENKLWEEYPDPSYHKRFFDAYGLLRKAFNGTFAAPTGVRFQARVSAQHANDLDVFKPDTEPALTRLLAAGIAENAILNRLYNEKIQGDDFPEAENILWQVKEISTSDKEVTYEIISSELWFGDFEDVESFTGSTHADAIKEDEE